MNPRSAGWPPPRLQPGLPRDFLFAANREGVRFTEHVLWVSVSRQTLWHLMVQRYPRARWSKGRFPRYGILRRSLISTSRFGNGQIAGSRRTPLGLHRIAEKIGGGWPVGTVFRSRRVVGFTWKNLPLAPITSRILWLEGLEPGFNRGGTVDSHARYIYLHGTGNEASLGRPASGGCIHLAADDLIPLYDRLPSGSLVWIGR